MWSLQLILGVNPDNLMSLMASLQAAHDLIAITTHAHLTHLQLATHGMHWESGQVANVGAERPCLKRDHPGWN
jgi:hypothetical protein